MEINSQNYETVLIDYFDGNLNALEVAEVLLFLEQHPDIKKEFETFGTLPDAEKITVDSDFKLNLKKLNAHKPLAEKSFNELIIAQMEGDCSENESAIIHELIESNKSLNKLKNTFQLTKLVPDLTVSYPSKPLLKRKEAVVFYLNKRFAAAAVMLLLVSLLFLIYRNSNQPLNEVKLAQNKINFKEINQNKDNTKLTEIPTERRVAIIKNEPKSTQTIAQQSTINNTPTLNTETKSSFEQISPLAIKKLAIIENTLALKNNAVVGELVPVEIVVSKESTKKEDFLTIGNFMKKKLIERGKDNLVELEKPSNQDELAIDPLTVASVGAGILEKATGKKVFLTRSYDKRGSLKSYTLAAGDFKFERIK